MRRSLMRITTFLGVLAVAALTLGGCHEGYSSVGYGYGSTSPVLVGYSYDDGHHGHGKHHGHHGHGRGQHQGPHYRR